MLGTLAPWFFVTLVSTAPPAGEWESMYVDEGIEGYSQEVSGSDLFGFKGIGEIQASVAKIFCVISDAKHEYEWVFLMKENEVIKEDGPFYRIEHHIYGLPWPVSNRDFVFEIKAKTLDAKGTVLVTMQSVDFPGMPEPKGVRGRIVSSRFLLEPLGPNRTRVTVEIFADSAGILPGWVVYLVQRNWPYKTLTGLRQQVLQDYTKDAALPPYVGAGQ